MMDTLLEQLDERIRRVALEMLSARTDKPAPTADILDDETRAAIREQTLIAHKTYLTRKEASKYLGISERSIGEWAARPVEQNPFPESQAGGEPRYKRAAIDAWTERERKRQRLKLAG